MRTKTFKIGEYSSYGIWKLTLKGDTLKIEGIYWNTKEVAKTEIFDNLYACLENQVQNYLYEITTSYYVDKMMKWIRLNYYVCENIPEAWLTTDNFDNYKK